MTARTSRSRRSEDQDKEEPHHVEYHDEVKGEGKYEDDHDKDGTCKEGARTRWTTTQKMMTTIMMGGGGGGGGPRRARWLLAHDSRPARRPRCRAWSSP